MSEIHLSNREARRFILLKQGLLGKYKFTGKAGILDFVHQSGCIQFDPIDVCGKNAEIVLQSRIKGFRKTMLYELLYTERKLIDYFDKNLSVFAVEDWKYFEREREIHRKWERSHDEIMQVHDKIVEMITERGALCSSDLDISGKVDWYWSRTNLSRAALEHMYFSGELAIHHKKGGQKYYDLIQNCIPAEILAQPDPYPDDSEHMKWRVWRRIGALGLLWNRASDAWLGISGLKASERNHAFSSLISEHKIVPVTVEDMKDTLYCRTEDIPLIQYIQTNPKLTKRCEFIAPLDNMMWDRNLIKALFDFEYKWEIYTPKSERKYGYYVLPVLYGEQFIGRIETVSDRKKQALNVLNIWYEPNVKVTKTLEEKIKDTTMRFETFALGTLE